MRMNPLSVLLDSPLSLGRSSTSGVPTMNLQKSREVLCRAVCYLHQDMQMAGSWRTKAPEALALQRSPRFPN